MCALCETFFTQESFRGCGLRKPTIVLIIGSEKEHCSFSCPHRRKCGFAQCPSTDLGRVDPQLSLPETSCGPHCGLTQPAPEVPFFSKRKEPKIRQRGGFLFGNTSEGHIPSGTSQSEVLSPCLLRQKANVRFCSYLFGQQVITSLRFLP